MKRMLSVLFIGVSLAFSQHNYLNGQLVTINRDIIAINVNGRVQSYPISKNVRIVKHLTKNGAIYEEPATTAEAKNNMVVTIKVVGGKVEEIILEVYR